MPKLVIRGARVSVPWDEGGFIQSLRAQLHQKRAKRAVDGLQEKD